MHAPPKCEISALLSTPLSSVRWITAVLRVLAKLGCRIVHNIDISRLTKQHSCVRCAWDRHQQRSSDPEHETTSNQTGSASIAANVIHPSSKRTFSP